MKWFWVKVVLRDGRGKMTGAVAHLPVLAPTAIDAIKTDLVIYAEDRLWASIDRAMHGSARLETLAVEIVTKEMSNG
jgi:hypothetical protein